MSPIRCIVRSAVLPAVLSLCTAPASAAGGSVVHEQLRVHGPIARPALILRATPETLDFGTILAGTTKTVALTLKNTHSVPVQVLSLAVDCTCVKTAFSDPVTLQPGESVQIPVTYITKNTITALTHTLSVTHSGAAAPHPIRVTAKTSRAIQSEPSFIDLITKDDAGDLPSRSGAVALRSLDGTPFRVLSANGAAPVLVDIADNPVQDPTAPAPAHRLRYDLTGVSDNDLPYFYVVQTDHPDAAQVDIRIMHFAPIMRFMQHSPIGVSPPHLLLGLLQPGGTHEASLLFSGVDAGSITDLRVAGGSMGVEILEEEVTDAKRRVLRVRLRFTATDGVPGAFRDRLLMTVVRGNGHKAEQEIALYGRLQAE